MDIISDSRSYIYAQDMKQLSSQLLSGTSSFYFERTEHPSQSYGTSKKRNKILNIGRRTILYETFFYSFSILN